MALDGFYYYAYNEVAFFTLNQVAPITRACRLRLVAPSHTHCRPAQGPHMRRPAHVATCPAHKVPAHAPTDAAVHIDT
jgi:hypothetical protein